MGELIKHEEWGVIQHQSEVLASSSIVPKAYRGKPADIIAAALLGREVGFSPMTSLQYIHVVDGKAGLSAEGMVALVRARGHSIDVLHMNDEGCKVRGTRVDNGDSLEFEFTRAHAQAAGLMTKVVWRSYFRSMAWARCVSQLCRSLWPDVIMGLSYTQEELESIAGVETKVETVEVQAIPAPDVAEIEDVAVVEETVDPMIERRAQLQEVIAGLSDEERDALRERIKKAGIIWRSLTAEQSDTVEEWIEELSPADQAEVESSSADGEFASDDIAAAESMQDASSGSTNPGKSTDPSTRKRRATSAA